MAIILVLPAVLSFLALAAHFLHNDALFLAIPCLLFPLLLLVRRRGVIRILQALLVLGAIEWLATIPTSMTRANHPPVAAAILIGAATITLISAALLQSPAVLRAHPRGT